MELSDDDPPEASKVRITDAGGAKWYWTKSDDGDVTVTKSGSSYTITGNIPFAGPQPSAPSKAPDIPKGTLTPFEIDVTCP